MFNWHPDLVKDINSSIEIDEQPIKEASIDPSPEVNEDSDLKAIKDKGEEIKIKR